jgi:hypothetical protein
MAPVVARSCVIFNWRTAPPIQRAPLQACREFAILF